MEQKWEIETPALEETEEEKVETVGKETKEYAVLRVNENNVKECVRGVSNISGTYADVNINDAWWFATLKDAKALLTLCKINEKIENATYKIICRTSNIEIIK